LLQQVQQTTAAVPNTSAGRGQLKVALQNQLKVHVGNLRSFGVFQEAGLDPRPVRSDTVVYDRNAAKRALLNLFGNSFNADVFLNDVFGNFSEIYEDNPSELVLAASSLAFPARVCTRLIEMPSLFENPYLYQNQYWSDVRYPRWLKGGGKTLDQTNWAKCCLAWAWGQECGLAYKVTSEGHEFTFEGDKWVNFNAFFTELPASPAWDRLLSALQERVWNNIPAAKRGEKLDQVVSFLQPLLKKVKPIVSEPDRVERIKLAQEIIRRESEKAEAAKKNNAVCAEIAMMFGESAEQAVEQQRDKQSAKKK
jgi:hypothetical protein